MNAPPPILRAKLDRILHEGFVHIRNHDLERVGPEVRQWVFHIADTLEPIPELYTRWDADAERFTRELIDDLANTVPHLGERFRMLLDMPDEEYAAFYLTPHPRPGEEAVAEPVDPPAARAA